jgi:YD repeat-containing protein
MESVVQRGLAVSIIIVLLTMSITGIAGSVSAKKNQLSEDDSSEIVNIKDDGDYYQTDYILGNGRHLGHYSALEKWTMTHREYTDYYEDPNDDMAFNALGTIAEIETVAWIAGVDVDANNIKYVEYDEETGLPSSFVYQDSDGEVHHVELTYDEDGNLVSYTETDQNGVETEIIRMRYDSTGRLNQYARTVDEYTTEVIVGRGTGDMIDSYTEEVIELHGSSKFYVHINVTAIIYDDLGWVFSFTINTYDGMKKTTATTTTFEYDMNGRVVGKSETITSSDPTDPVTTRETSFTYNNLGMIESTHVISQEDDGSNLGLVTVVETLFEYGGLGEVLHELSESWSFGVNEDDTLTASDRTYNSDGICTDNRELTLVRGSQYVHYLSYNRLGQLVDEMIVDHETGVMVDAGDLKDILADMSKEDIMEFMEQLSDGDISDYITILKNGEDSGKRANRSFMKKVKLDVLNINEEEEFAYFSDVLERYNRRDQNIEG